MAGQRPSLPVLGNVEVVLTLDHPDILWFSCLPLLLGLAWMISRRLSLRRLARLRLSL